MSGRTRALTVLIYGLFGLFALLSWAIVFGLEQMAAVPMGWCPILVFAGSSISVPIFVAGIAAVAVFYVWIIAAVSGVSRRKRWGTVSLVVLLTLDAALSVILTITTWWYLLAIALDILLLLLSLWLFRAAGQEQDC